MSQKVYLSKLAYRYWINRKKLELKIEKLLLTINKHNKTYRYVTFESEAFWVSFDQFKSVSASFDKCRKKFIYRNWPIFAKLKEKIPTKD